MLPPFQGDFGGAYLLRTRAAFDAEVRTAEFVVRIRANAPFATVEMTGTVASADVRNLTGMRCRKRLISNSQKRAKLSQLRVAREST